jgi:hypothetical protein
LRTFGPDPDGPSWKIREPEKFTSRAFSDALTLRDRTLTVEFVRDRVLRDPDFGEALDDHTRGERVPGTDVELIWTFDPKNLYVEIVTPVPFE